MTDLHLDRLGARIAYDVTPGFRGPAIVALHGLTASRANDVAAEVFDWRPLAADGRTLVRYDARGHGASTGRAEPDDWRWENLAADLLELLDLVSPDAPVDVVGASMGTGTLLTAATIAPERFRRLVCVIPPTAWDTRTAQASMYLGAADLIERSGLEAWMRAVAAFPPLPILADNGFPTGLAPDIPEDLLPTVLRGAALADMPDPDAIAALSHEVLLLPWAGDPGHPVSTAERLHELLPISSLHLATTGDDLRAWPQRVAAFLEA